MTIRVREIRLRDRSDFQVRVAGLEKGVSYPLGTDRFEIDHGEDYFAFFDRLGTLTYLAALDGDRVVAVLAGMLRRIPAAPGKRLRRVWYSGDLKVDPDYRGQRIPWKMLLHAFPRKYPICSRGYAISMNPGDGSENRVVRLLSTFWVAPTRVATTLHLYSLDAESMRGLAPILESSRGPLSYLSLAGKKDIVLESTGKPMPLLHVQFGPCAESGIPWPIDGSVHMFCVPAGDPVESDLSAQGHVPSATATVLAHRMKRWDWRFILTSDI
jgi:GNAT superfamily N-acetyltransferase